MPGEHLGSTPYRQTLLQCGGAGIRERQVWVRAERKSDCLVAHNSSIYSSSNYEVSPDLSLSVASLYNTLVACSLGIGFTPPLTPGGLSEYQATISSGSQHSQKTNLKY